MVACRLWVGGGWSRANSRAPTGGHSHTPQQATRNPPPTTVDNALCPSPNALAAGPHGVVARLVPRMGLAQEAIVGHAVRAVAAPGATDHWGLARAAKAPAGVDRLRGGLRDAGTGPSPMGFR